MDLSNLTVSQKTGTHYRYYFILLFFMLLIGAIIPSLFFWVAPSLENVHFSFFFIDKNAECNGLLYTLAASMLMVLAASLFPPFKPTRRRQISSYLAFRNYRNILFWAGLVGLFISIILDSILGRSPSNIVAQRPQVAVYLGYFAAILSPAAIASICTELRLISSLTKKNILLVFLMFLRAALAQSRSGLVEFVFIFICSLAYGDNRRSFRSILKPWLILILIVVVALTLFGQLIRYDFDTKALGKFIPEITERLFANNAALYLGFVDFKKMNQILLEGQPRVLFQQLFSFMSRRTEYPSSFRLREFWGGEVAEDEKGHIAGYAYGWLGLTYGLVGWYGLLLVFFIFSIFAKLLRELSKRRITLFNSIFFAYLLCFLLEFFMNLGLDSYVEKVFKSAIYYLTLIIIIRTIKLIQRSKLNISKVGA